MQGVPPWGLYQPTPPMTSPAAGFQTIWPEYRNVRVRLPSLGWVVVAKLAEASGAAASTSTNRTALDAVFLLMGSPASLAEAGAHQRCRWINAEVDELEVDLAFRRPRKRF